jgi:hypothetical protein
MGITNRYLIITIQELYIETNFFEADHEAEQCHTIMMMMMMMMTATTTTTTTTTTTII